MCSDEQVGSVHCEAAAELVVNFRAGLFGIGSLADVVIHSAGANAARESRIACANQRNNIRLVFRPSGVPASADNARRIPSCTSPGRETKNLVSLIGLQAVGHRQHLRRHGNVLPGDGPACQTRRYLRIAPKARNHLLRVGHKEERQVVAVIKHSEAGSKHGLAVGRPGEANARLPIAVVRLHILGQARLIVPAQAEVHRELGREPPLILGKEAPIAVVNLLGESVEQTRWKRVRPS